MDAQSGFSERHRPFQYIWAIFWMEPSLKPKGNRMNALRKKLLFLTAAVVTMWALTVSPSAQTAGAEAAKAAMEDAARQAGVSSSPKSSAAAPDKANAAMTGASTSLPTEADRKASAAMRCPNC